jgi:RimJ/RimL family protein N-acetyltransferase
MRVIDSLNLQIEADRVPEVWRQLLWDVEEEYLATNYIRDIYDTAWADAALAVQAAKIKDKVNVRKVFIIDDEQELRNCLDLFHRQDSAGIVARYIYKNDMGHNLQAAGKIAKLGGQFDFGIFDRKFVLRWNLAPKKRTVESGSIVTNLASVEEFQEIFEALYGAAQPLPPRLEVRPLNEKERAEIYEWPHYSAPYEEFNYAIERKVGWLDKQGRNTGALALGGIRENKLEAFSLLVPTGRGSVEFYVAVRATRVHKGVGREMTRCTIRYAFKNCGADRIWLKVRKNHPFGRRLYEESGFVLCGTKQEEVMGKQVEFDVMELVNRPS